MSKQVNGDPYGAVSESGHANLRLLEEYAQIAEALRQALIDGENSGDAGELDMNQIKGKSRRRMGSRS
jgi:antitoxin ParD1/3/4